MTEKQFRTPNPALTAARQVKLILAPFHSSIGKWRIRAVRLKALREATAVDEARRLHLAREANALLLEIEAGREELEASIALLPTAAASASQVNDTLAAVEGLRLMVVDTSRVLQRS